VETPDGGGVIGSAILWVRFSVCDGWDQLGEGDLRQLMTGNEIREKFCNSLKAKAIGPCAVSSSFPTGSHHSHNADEPVKDCLPRPRKNADYNRATTAPEMRAAGGKHTT